MADRRRQAGVLAAVLVAAGLSVAFAESNPDQETDLRILTSVSEVLPPPREVRYGDSWDLRDGDVWIWSASPVSEIVAQIGETLVENLGIVSRGAFTVRRLTPGSSLPGSGFGLALGALADGTPVTELLRAADPEADLGSLPSDGYFIRILADKRRPVLVCVGRDEPGLFFGTQSLLQMFSSGSGHRFREAAITDWPAYKIRAANPFVWDSESGKLDRARTLRSLRWLAHFKFNTVFLSPAQGYGVEAWDGLPSDAVGTASEVVQWARGHGLHVMAALRPPLEEGLAALTPDQAPAWTEALQPLLASGIDQVALFLDPVSTSAYKENPKGALAELGLFPNSATSMCALMTAAHQALQKTQPEIELLLCPPWAQTDLILSTTPESGVVQAVSADLRPNWIFVWAGPDANAAPVTVDVLSEYEKRTGCDRPVVWDSWNSGLWPEPYPMMLGPELEDRSLGTLLVRPLGTGLQRLYGWSAGWALWNPGSYEVAASETKWLERALGPGCGEDGAGFMKAARDVLARVPLESRLPDLACLAAGTETWHAMEALRTELSERLNRLEAFSWNEELTSPMRTLVVDYTALLERCRLSEAGRIESLMADGKWQQVLREQEYIRGSDLPPLAKRRSELISGCAFVKGGEVSRAAEMLTAPLLPGEEELLAPLHESLTKSIFSSVGLLGAPDEIQALPRMVADGQFSLVQRGGKWCLGTRPEIGSHAIYFDISEMLYSDVDMDIRLAVEILDSAEGWVFVEYDSRFEPAPDPIYLKSGGYRLTGSGGWKQVVFYLSAARFGDRQAAGTDMRLVCREAPILISNLELIP